MRRVSKVVGRALVIDRDNVDTDQIIPSRYLKRTTRTGYAEGLFAEWRTDPAFPLNDPTRKGATILIVGANFGCGSSREHAAWALDEYGFQAIIAASFADIFRSNCLKVGVVPVVLPAEDVRATMRAAEDPRAQIEVDVQARTVRAAGVDASFALDDFSRWRLLEGLDDIALALRYEEDITAYEIAHAPLPANVDRAG
jgi:3-isopropylmalate/(R)-2-methylmalate dehydratase small subunit